MKRKCVKVEILPDNEQKKIINREINCSRFVYNHFLMLRFDLWKNEKRNLSHAEEIEMLQDLRQEEEWLKNVEKQALEQAIRDLDTDLYNYMQKKDDYPKCRRKEDKVEWYKTKSEDDSIELLNSEKLLKLPCLGTIKINSSEYLNGQVLYVKIRKIEDRYEALLTLEIQ